MVEALFVRRAFELLAIFHLLTSVNSIANIEKKSIETILKTMKIEDPVNLTRYRMIENAVRQYLMNYDQDDSPVNLFLHPKANPHVIEAVAKACSERKQTVLWTERNRPNDHSCNHTETCSRVFRTIAIYPDVDVVNSHNLKMLYGNAWNSRSEIIILITKLIPENEDSIDKVMIQEILENFWSLDCLNVVIMTMPKCEKNCTIISEPKIFSYDPFVLLDGKSAESEERGRLLENSTKIPFFPDKLENLHGYPIKVSIYHLEPHSILINFTELGSGTHVSILRWLSNWLNFTIDLKTAPVPASSYKISLPDGREVGPIGDVIKNRSYYLANSVLIGAVDGMKVEFIRPYARANIAILVPRAGPMPGIIRIFRSIDRNVAIATFGCLIVLKCYFLVRKKKHPFLNTYRLLIHQQLEGISNNFAERLFLISWIYWAFVVSLALQSHLIEDLTDPPFYKSIDSLDELVSSTLTLMTDPVNLVSINNSASETKNILAENAIEEFDFSKCVRMLEKYRNVACAMDESMIKGVARKLNNKYHNKNQWRRGIVHIVKEYLTDNWRTMIVKEGFPYLDKFNAAWDIMREMGFIGKWVEDSKRSNFQEASSETTFKLNMLHFEGPFKLFVLGQGIAFVVFIVEIVIYHAKRRFGASRNHRQMKKMY